MGSLINGSPPTQRNECVINTGHSIDVKNYGSDDLVVERPVESNADLLAELEATVRGLNPILWLDMDDTSTMTLDGDNRISEWRHKLDATVKAEASGAFAGRGPTLTDSMVRFAPNEALSLGEQLDSYLTGASPKWTICTSIYVDGTNTSSWMCIISKIATTGSNDAFLLYVEDYPGSTTQPALYVVNNGNGLSYLWVYKAPGQPNNREHIITASLNTPLAGLNRIDLRLNNNNEIPTHLAYDATNFAGVKDSTWPLLIGAPLYTVAQGYRAITGIHELIIFPDALSDETKLKVETYLAMKRGTTKYLESHRPHD